MTEQRFIPGERFPIQGDNFPIHFANEKNPMNAPRCELKAGWVPWVVAEVAYKAYCKAGHGTQTLLRLAERGGFGWFELFACLRGDYHSQEISKITDMFHDVAHEKENNRRLDREHGR